MPQYAFRATDRMGNAVDGNVTAPDMSSATRQIQQMGYTPVSVQASVETPTLVPVAGLPTASAPVATPPAAPPPPAAPGRRKPVDLTQPVTEMPEAAVDLFAPSAPAEPTQQITSEAAPAPGAYAAAVPDSKAETTSRFAKLEPWERGGQLPQPPPPSAQPTTQMAAAGLGVTQPMSAMGSIPEHPAPSSVQLVRGLENIPFGANARRRNVSLFQRFQEVMIYPIFSGVVLKDLAPFYRQFATLIGAGLPLYQSLVALADNTKNARLKEVATNGATQVQAGGRLSDVLAAYPWIFPPLHLEMVRASEQGGLMDQVFRQIADYVEHEIEIRRLISRETLYPKIVLFVLAMLMGRPGIMEGIPAIVELVLGNTSGYLRDTVGFALMILVPIMILVVCFRLFWFNIPSFRNSYDAFKINLPILGKLIRMFAVAKFARTYAALSRAGFPVGAALQISGDASGNVVLARAAQRAMREADRGVMPSVALAATGQFPPIAMDMLRTGEMSGTLDDMMDKVADYLEAEAKLKSHQVAMIFSVLVLLLVALIVLRVMLLFWGGYGAGLSQAANG